MLLSLLQKLSKSIIDFILNVNIAPAYRAVRPRYPVNRVYVAVTCVSKYRRVVIGPYIAAVCRPIPVAFRGAELRSTAQRRKALHKARAPGFRSVTQEQVAVGREYTLRRLLLHPFLSLASVVVGVPGASFAHLIDVSKRR